MNTDIAFGVIIGFLFICLIVLFCIVIIKLYIQKIKKYNAMIYEKEITFQKTLNSALIESQEHLLNNISQDLHDDAGQQLTVINFQLEHFKLDWPDSAADLNPVSESLAHLADSLRKVSHSLNHQWLSQNGLIKAIAQEVERIKKNKLIQIEYSEKAGNKTFKPEEQIVLFRIFQECLNNAFKHARASQISIQINQNPFSISILDNGIGFDRTRLNTAQGIGIANCIQRASVINYHFDIQSQPNQGTKIILSEQT